MVFVSTLASLFTANSLLDNRDTSGMHDISRHITMPEKYVVMFVCVCGIQFASFCDISIEFWNYSDSVVFLFFIWYIFLQLQIYINAQKIQYIIFCLTLYNIW